MHGNLFYGCGTALVTPFKGNRVDFDALESLIDWQLDCGADAIVVLGTTGEPATVSDSERSAIVECAAARCRHRAPLVVGTGSNDTRRAVTQSVEARRLGAEALLVVTPYYNRASRSGLIGHFNAVADCVDIPVIMYNVPARTGVNLDADTVAELAKHPNLCAVKEASGSLKQMTDLARACGDGIAIYCGNDDQVPAVMALGARGVISVAANLIPGVMSDMVSDWLRGESKKCLEAQLEWLPLIRRLFDEVSPIPVKAALAMMGRIENTLRLPLCPLDADHEEQLRREMKRMGLVG
ncbi:MAG: 4-hydroxy-tetrahydrodipicolinate synthase [Clostridia bacterium]|nr:4-hydroxy-tetrahydrodipicolinate synthase [Clostridia bacterium]